MQEYFQAKTEQMRMETDEILTSVGHSPLRGAHAEQVLKNFLGEILPKRYEVGTGLVHSVVGGKTKKSKQVDLVIYDHFQNPPLLVFGGFKIFPAECVYAAIATKIGLDSSSLLSAPSNCFDNIASVKQLPKHNFLRLFIAPGISGGGKPSDTLGIVFAFRGNVSLQTLANNLVSKRKELQNDPEWYKKFPDIICVLDKGLIVTNPKQHELTVDDQLVQQDFFVSPRQPVLMLFTSLLISLLSQRSLTPVDLFRYAYMESK